jgi:NAD(P)-dependent dehydrogenase (short-subunit alcohol dehydrogenase family)
MEELEKEGTISKSASLEVLKKREPVTLEQLVNNKKLLVTASPIWDDYGGLVMVVSNVRDITELEYLKKEVRKSKEIMKQMQYKLLHDDSIIARDPKSFLMIDRANRVAKKSTTVIITGETGTGKEVFARYIHNQSKRKDEAFININCGAIPENLVESELFGHVKGSFTGANTSKAGIIEMADKGTLFLDEIGELPLSSQVKLLRVLQEGIRHMLKRKTGVVVNISSTAGVTGGSVGPQYGASKAGMIALTKSTSKMYARDGIRINAVVPGDIKTEMLEGILNDPAVYEQRTGNIPMGRFSEPEEIANAVLFLATPMSSFSTGAFVHATGGRV